MGNWVGKLKRGVKELIGGKNTYISEKQKARIRMDSPKTETKRTGQTKTALEQAGLTPDEIARLQGKVYKPKRMGAK